MTGWWTRARRLMAVSLAVAAAAPGAAQVKTIDPNSASRDLAPVPQSEAGYGTRMPVEQVPAPPSAPPPPETPPPAAAPATPPSDRTTTSERLGDAAADDPTRTYQRDDLLSAAEGVFGKGAEGLAKMIENVLAKQGRPDAYIGGREIGGAVVAGLRYGSGTLHHKVEGDRPVYWTGPSLGFDFGGNGSKTFVLVYNLYDSQDLYHRFPAGEGGLYAIGGFTASYLRRGDIVLIPIRLGVGWRLGVNIGYMKFTDKPKISPF